MLSFNNFGEAMSLDHRWWGMWMVFQAFLVVCSIYGRVMRCRFRCLFLRLAVLETVFLFCDRNEISEIGVRKSLDCGEFKGRIGCWFRSFFFVHAVIGLL